jgi:hypothetical protein
LGMHFGVVAARTSVDSLLGALPAVAGYQLAQEIPTLDSMPDRVGEEPPLVTGNLDGVAFVMDPGMLVSTDADAIVAASAALATTVAAVGAETTSGTYWLTVAENGSLARLHWNSLWGQSEPYDVGPALPSEARGALEDVDGIGLFRAFSALGFDYPLWSSRGPFSVLGVEYHVGKPGPFGAAQNEFAKAHSIFDPNETPTPVVVTRGNGGSDIVAAGSRLPDGTVVRGAAPKKAGILGKLFGR